MNGTAQMSRTPDGVSTRRRTSVVSWAVSNASHTSVRSPIGLAWAAGQLADDLGGMTGDVLRERMRIADRHVRPRVLQ